MKTKEVAIWITIIVVLIGGMWLLINAVNNSPSPSTLPAIKIPDVSDKDFIKGDPNAKVTLIEYADYQCPACKTYFSLLTQFASDFDKDVRIVYRFFPLINTHQNSMISSQVAYAAWLQGKFWEMSKILYENQDNWGNSSKASEIFTGYASKLGLDLTKFESDTNKDSTKNFITNAFDQAVALGITSTPSFFLNGSYIQAPTNYEAFKKLIQNEIEAH